MYKRRAIFQLFGAAMLLTIFALFSLQPAHAQEVEGGQLHQATMSDALRREFATSGEPVTFLAILRDQLDAAEALAAAGVQSAAKSARGAALYHALIEHAARTQAPLRAWLDEQGVDYRPFYIVNMVEVTGDAVLASGLLLRPEIERLEANPEAAALHANQSPLPAGWSFAPREASISTATLPWGLSYTNADDVWNLGYRGRGIVIASQDTGVRWDHPALRSAYRGWVSDTMTVTHVYNWFDAWGVDANRQSRCSGDATVDAQIPCDDQGHGTHTVGTMVGDATSMGDTVLGMAPDAQWIGCRNMTNGVGTPASYTTCFEFFLAPYPQGGDPFTDGKPDLAPHIINNSWGCPVEEGCDAASLRQVVEAVRAAGILVVASAGNKGSACSSVVDPIATHDASFTIGAHNLDGNIASFSSRGPVTVDGSSRRKPDIAAPGVGVRSTSRDGGVNFFLQGTSMAAPHVAGAAALLWSAVPTLTGEIDLTEQIFLKSAVVATSAQPCGAFGAGVAPNNIFGFGRLDALAAIELAQQPATATVSVLDRFGQPIPNATLLLRDNLTDFTVTAVSDANGQATFAHVYASESGDRFTLTVQATGHEFTPVVQQMTPASATTITLQANQLVFLPVTVRQE
jgi:subtilisin family serine protease